MSALARPIAHTEATHAALADALTREAKLLDDLLTVMRRQRESVARDDLDGVDESVYATHRVLVTLGEARRRRRTLNHLLGEGDDLSIQALEDAMGGELPTPLREAADLLTAGARLLQHEVDINRRVLREAIAAGDRAARSIATAAASLTGMREPRTGGVLLDRRA